MFRSRLPLALLILLVMFPYQAAAQAAAQADPEPGDPIDWQTEAEETEISVNRTYEVDQGGTSGLFGGDLVQVFAIGIVSATRADARVSYNVSDDYLLATFAAGAEEEGFTSEDPVSVEIDSIGDQSEAWNMEASVAGNPLTLNFSLVIVQQEAWVQILTGVGFGESQVDALVEMAVDLAERWPNDDPVTLDGDEMRTGGPWAMAPQPGDLPSELEWVESADTGPEVTFADGADSSGDSGADAGNASEPGVTIPDAVKGGEAEETPAPDPTEPADEGSDAAGDADTVGDAKAVDDEAAATPAPAAPDTPATPDVAAPTAETPDRLVSADPVPATLWIILPADSHVALDGNACAGAGAYEKLRPGGVISLINQDGGSHVESAMLEANGMIYYDTVLGQDVCAFTVGLTSVPPGISVLVDIDRVVLGHFTTSTTVTEDGAPVIYEIVIGQ